MKIKKTLALIIISALTVGTMAGCSRATLNYSTELSNTAKWEATTSNVEGTVNVNAQGIKEEVTFTATGYKAKDKTYVDMKFNNTSGKINIPEIKEYLDGNTIYINKGYFEGIYAMTGQPIPEGLANIKEEYIAIDSLATTGMDINKIQAFIAQPDAMVQVGKLVFGENNDLDAPFVQDGREYTINLDADKTVDLSAKAIKAGTNNLESLNEIFKLGLNSENIEKAKKAITDGISPLMLDEIKAQLDGSTINIKDIFKDDIYTSEFNMNLQINNFGNISCVVKSTATKSEVKEITLPTSKVNLTKEEYAKLLVPTKSTIATTSNVITK